MIGRGEQLGDRRVLDDAADLAAHELGGVVVRRSARPHVGERLEEAEAAVRPAALELLAALVVADLERGLVVGDPRSEDALHGPSRLFPVRGEGQLHAGLLRRVARAVVRRNAEVRRALEDRDVLGLPGDDRDRLDPRRASADDAHPAAAEVDALVGPAAGVERRSGERVAAGDVGDAGAREAARRHHAVPRGDALPAVGRDQPLRSGLVELRTDDPRVELDAAAQVEEIGDVVQVREDLGLGRIALAPRPAGDDPVVEAVLVVGRLDIAARAGIAIPEPRAADAGAGLDHSRRQPARAHRVQRVQTREPRAHDQDVNHPHAILCACPLVWPDARRHSDSHGDHRLRPLGTRLPRAVHRGEPALLDRGHRDERPGPRRTGRAGSSGRRDRGIARGTARAELRPRRPRLARPRAPGAGPRRALLRRRPRDRQAVRRVGRRGRAAHRCSGGRRPAAHRLPEPALGRRFPHRPQAGRLGRPRPGASLRVDVRALVARAPAALAGHDHHQPGRRDRVRSRQSPRRSGTAPLRPGYADRRGACRSCVPAA